MVDKIISRVKAALDSIKDHRMPAGNLQHSLGDTMMSAYAMFHLKYPSLLVLRQRLEERWSNMERIYKIKSIPKHTAMRTALDGVKPQLVSDQFKVVHQFLGEHGLWESRKTPGEYLAISVAGTEHYYAGKNLCEHCLERKRRNGEIEYHHQLNTSRCI